jgi:predicted RNA-binding protein
VVNFSKEYNHIDGNNIIAAAPNAVVLFDHIISFDSPIAIKLIIDKLNFIPINRVKWGAVMQTGCRKISEKDYESIINEYRFNIRGK